MSRAAADRHAPREVDEYLAAQAPEFRVTLEQLRAIIRSAAPDCTERVSYRIPIFRLTEDLVAISAAKSHCGLHTMSRAIPVALRDELTAAGIRASGTTLRIGAGGDVPVSLIERVVRARRAELEGDDVAAR